MFCILYFCAAGFAAVCLWHQWGLTAPADVLGSISLAARWRRYMGQSSIIYVWFVTLGDGERSSFQSPLCFLCRLRAGVPGGLAAVSWLLHAFVREPPELLLQFPQCPCHLWGHAAPWPCGAGRSRALDPLCARAGLARAVLLPCLSVLCVPQQLLPLWGCCLSLCSPGDSAGARGVTAQPLQGSLPVPPAIYSSRWANVMESRRANSLLSVHKVTFW